MNWRISDHAPYYNTETVFRQSPIHTLSHQKRPQKSLSQTNNFRISGQSKRRQNANQTNVLSPDLHPVRARTKTTRCQRIAWKRDLQNYRFLHYAPFSPPTPQITERSAGSLAAPIAHTLPSNTLKIQVESTSRRQRKKIWHGIHKCTENRLIYSHNGETNRFRAWTFKVKSDTHSYIHLLCLSIREHRITSTVHENLRSLQDRVVNGMSKNEGPAPQVV